AKSVMPHGNAAVVQCRHRTSGVLALSVTAILNTFFEWSDHMGRPPKDSIKFGSLPLRQYWQEVNRVERAAEVYVRAKRKATDGKRRKCRCDAYKFPHRPGGGLCRWPDPPEVRWH